jgi:N-acetyl-alpha-D-glucosaminyl L-malate synthase BshA
VTRWSIDHSDRVTAVSDWLAAETRRIFKTDAKIRTIPNFVDTERFRPGVDPERRACFARPDEKIVLHASNFRPVKRPGWVVELFARLAARERAVLVLAGDGPELAKSEYRIRELGLSDRVRTLGAYEAMEELLPLADIYLQPSEHESFGLASLEAMSAGVPVLVTRNGGPGELVVDGDSGFLLDPEDMEAWVLRADALLADEAARRAVGEAARRRACEHFATEGVTDRYEALFQELVDSKRD